MAGDWIKMRADLFTHPKVVRMSSALKADTLRTVGGLMSAWCLFDAHSEDGCLEGYSPDVLDAHLRWDGFCAAMMAVGWLEHDPKKGLLLPRFDTHNGQSAKRRAQDAERKRDVRKTSAPEADKTRTREEKRREELSVPIGTGDKSPVDPVEIIFGYGVPLLTSSGSTDKAARSFLGGLRKSHGDMAVVNALRDCLRAKPLQPLEWLAAALPPGGRIGKANAQEALEQANRDVAARWLAEQGVVQ